MSIICPACNYDNPSDAEFCDACGYELATVAPVKPEVAPPVFPKLPEVPPIETPESEPVSPLGELNKGSSTQLPQSFPVQTPPPSVSTARLISKQAGSPTKEFPLDGSNVLIGKFDPDMGPVDIDLEGFTGDETISRNHGEIYLEGGVWKIKDLGSSNGIFLKPNGQSRFGARITVPEILNSGDEIAIAKVRFLFQSP